VPRQRKKRGVIPAEGCGTQGKKSRFLFDEGEEKMLPSIRRPLPPFTMRNPSSSALLEDRAKGR